MTLVDQLLKVASRDIDTVYRRVRFVEMMAKHVGRIADPSEQARYVWLVAQTSGLPADTIRRQVASK